jgi:tRNA(Arg) A34 adenosine deaminase TadA
MAQSPLDPPTPPERHEAATSLEADGSSLAHGVHLQRCVDLAREALDAGDDPFGSLIVDGDGRVLAEARNREVTAEDPTAHPELELAHWALRNLNPQERARATVYTSGEHCPMCAAAHGWVGLGAIVFAASSAQLSGWRTTWGLEAGPVAPLPASVVLPTTRVTGPVSPYDELMMPLHQDAANRRLGPPPSAR